MYCWNASLVLQNIASAPHTRTLPHRILLILPKFSHSTVLTVPTFLVESTSSISGSFGLTTTMIGMPTLRSPCTLMTTLTISLSLPLITNISYRTIGERDPLVTFFFSGDEATQALFIPSFGGVWVVAHNLGKEVPNDYFSATWQLLDYDFDLATNTYGYRLLAVLKFTTCYAGVEEVMLPVKL